jgi:hypothetical protein
MVYRICSTRDEGTIVPNKIDENIQMLREINEEVKQLRAATQLYMALAERLLATGATKSCWVGTAGAKGWSRARRGSAGDLRFSS